MGRAEYLKAWRAARSVKLADYVCEGCGETFTPARIDARFCTAACRSATWRPILHHAVHHQPHGYARWTCMQQVGEREFCDRPAFWRHDSVSNRERALILQAYYCDEHIGLHHPPDVRVGESIRDVMRRDGEAARRRHGTEAN
jgi:hypothetical protein